MFSPYFDDGQVALWQGHVLDVLRELPAESVQCVVTSPPYWSLRAYGTAPQVWGGDAEHAHTWGETEHSRQELRRGVNLAASVHSTRGGAKKIAEVGYIEKDSTHCPCGAWKGELGHEPTPQMFVAHLVQVFAEVKRVLKPDGCLFVNLGDSYSGSGKGPSSANGLSKQHTNMGSLIGSTPVIEGTKAKSLVLIPERFALAMADDGWYVRSRIAWCKRAPMPESVRDRPTGAWEHIWLFSKNARYFWDSEAVREELQPKTLTHRGGGNMAGKNGNQDEGGMVASGNWGAVDKPRIPNEAGRNMWNYWEIEDDGEPQAPANPYWKLSPDPEPLAHFATFPREIPRRCIAAATSERGECPQCGKSWVRIVERSGGTTGRSWHNHENDLARGQRGGDSAAGLKTYRRDDKGWAPQCDHGLEPVPSTILDPFVGSGTTTMVARSMFRRSIGIDLSEDYLRTIAVRKNAQMAMMPERDVS